MGVLKRMRNNDREGLMNLRSRLRSMLLICQDGCAVPQVMADDLLKRSLLSNARVDPDH